MPIGQVVQAAVVERDRQREMKQEKVERRRDDRLCFSSHTDKAEKSSRQQTP